MPLPPGEPLGFYAQAFRAAAPLEAQAFAGVYDGLVVGPAWFRAAFRAMMDGGGLRGWRGKTFAAGGEGFNRCRRGGEEKAVAPMYVAGMVASVIDGRPTLALRYRGKSPRALIQDEVRAYDERTVLGMTYLDIPGGRATPMPFALVRR